MGVHQSPPEWYALACRNSFGGDNATYWSYPFNKLYKRVGAPDVTLGVDSVGNLLQTGKPRSRLSKSQIIPSGKHLHARCHAQWSTPINTLRHVGKATVSVQLLACSLPCTTTPS